MKRLIILPVLIVVLFIVIVGQSHAELIVPSATYPTIQSAIDAASTGDVVIVEDGTYTGDGNINLDFKGKAITVKSRNGPDNCIIDCELIAGGVRFVSGETRNAKLDGFTIQNTSQEPEVGAAILIENSSPTISNCVITKCQYCGEPWTIGCIDFFNRYGIYGAVRIENSSPIIVGCIFSGNSLGSIRVDNSQVTIIESHFLNNVTDYLYHQADTLYLSNSTVLISKSEFIGNWGDSVIEASNCIYKMENSIVKNCSSSRFRALKEGSELLHCRFINNYSEFRPGAMEIENSFLHIFDCVFEENLGDYETGAINIYNSSTTIENCYFKNNNSLNTTGAMYIYTDESYEFEPPKVLNTIFEGNTTPESMIVWIRGRSIFTNCTFVGNKTRLADDRTNYGLFTADNSTLVSNSIFWNNIPRTFWGSIPSLSHCNIDQDGFAGTNGNVSQPPSFINAGYWDDIDPDSHWLDIWVGGDYHLNSDSPCKDTGDNNAPELPNTDKDGNPRIMDGIVDMGAYEYLGNQEPPVAYDMDVSTEEDTPVDVYLESYDKDSIYEFSSDKSGNNNNFSANGDGYNLPEPSPNYAEGHYSAHFERDNNEYLILDDVSAKVDLPWKNGTLNKTGTVWLKFRTSDFTLRQVLFGKYEINPENKTFLISTTPSGQLQVNIGYDEGSSFKLHIHDSILNTETWYAVGVCFEQNDGYSTDPEKVYIKIRTVGDGNVVGTDYFANAFDDPDSEEISLDIAPYMIGAVFRSPSIRQPFEGYIDEVVMFNEKMIGSDFEQYATGSYSGGSDCLLDFEYTPLSFSIVSDPSNGTLSGTLPNVTYTPDNNFFGDDSFTFKVNDGYVDSNIATVNITVEPENDPPIITGQLPLETESGIALEVTLDDLMVNDAENDYPEEFTLHVQAGPNYTLNGNTITPDVDFMGGLSVPVYVNDGTDNSNTYNLTVNVIDDCPNDPNKTKPGVCGCGIPDTDTDNDFVPDCSDNCPNDPNKINPGICGCGVSDFDSDQDGTPDCNDNCDSNLDTDGDGVGDCDESCPNDPDKTDPGVCGCGLADTDSDNDGIIDCIDFQIIANITSPASNQKITVGKSVNFQCTVVGGNPPFTYSWNFDGAVANTTQEDPGDVLFAEVGTYTVVLAVADDDGDIDSDTVTITVEEESGGGGGGGGGGFCFIGSIR